MDLDTILAVVTALGVREIVGKALDAWTGRQPRRLSEVQALWAENRQLRTELSRVVDRVGELEGKVDHYEVSAQVDEERRRRLIKGNCRYWRTLPCPQLVEMHDPDVTPPARAPELVGGAGTKE